MACLTVSITELRTPKTDKAPWIAVAGVLLAAAFVFLTSTPVAAQSAAAEQYSESPGLRLAVKGGAAERRFPAAGLLLSHSCPSGRCGFYARCSGVLGANDRFFTAGHCLTDRMRTYWVFLQDAGLIRGADSGVQHYCDARAACDPAVSDLASLRLIRPVPDIEIPRIGSDTDGPARIVGFGDSGPARLDHGILRSAMVTTVPCEDQGLICYRFSDDTPAACNHDSGGPMFKNDRLIGLARRSEYSCASGRGSYTDLTLPTVTAWWNADVGQGAVSRIGGAPDLAYDCIDRECWRKPSVTRAIRVQDEALRLTVTLNHSLLSGAAECAGGLRSCAVDYDLMLTGPEHGEDTPGCSCHNHFFQVAVCECLSPRPGIWHATIRTVGKQGPHQLTGRVSY